MKNKTLKRGKKLYRLVSINHDQVTTWYELENDKGETTWVGKKVFEDEFSEVKESETK